LLRIYLPGKSRDTPPGGTLHVRGPLRTPRDLKAVAELQSFSVEVEHLQVQNVGPIRFEVADQVLLVENVPPGRQRNRFHRPRPGSFGRRKELDLGLDGSVNMTLLQSLNPKILARGTLGVNLNASGTLSEPVLQGVWK
jgi:hypothetical protein